MRGFGEMLQVGVVGTGAWARNMLRVIQDSERAQIRMLCDRDPKVLAAVASKLPQTLTSTSYQEVVSDPTVDAVYVATPPGSHFEIAAAALRAGKHVLVEKPLTTSSADAAELVELAAAASKTLMVGHTFIYSPPVRKIKTLIDSGELGRVFYIDSQRVNLGKVQDSGVLWDLAPHDLSIILHWLGESPSSVFAAGGAFVSARYEDVAFLTLQFPSGVLAQISLSWLAPSKLRRTTITGDRKMVLYDDLAGPEAVKIYDQGVDRIRPPETFGEFQLTYRAGDVVMPRLENYEPLRVEWEHFLDCVDDGRTPQTSGAHGLQVVSVIEAARASAANGSPVVVCPRVRSPHP